MEHWMIVNEELEQIINDEEGRSLKFSSPEEAEEYIEEHGVNGTVVETPDITDGIP
jgi:hypothetical protein